MATTTAKTANQVVLEQIKLSAIRNDLREINALASTALNDDLAAKAALRTIMRISRDAIYR